MPVTTHIDQARSRVQAEQEALDDKLEAFDEFTDRVADLSADPAPRSTSRVTTTAGTFSQANPSPDDRCRTVRTAFAETIRPHSVADVDESESLLATIRNEFSDPIAVALAPTTDTSFSTERKQAIVSAGERRRAETHVTQQALEREDTRLEDAGQIVDDIISWLSETDETPLTDLGFETLRQRHEALARHRDRCEELAHQRQEFRQETTNQGVEIGIRHRSLIPYLYRDVRVDHPFLATVVRLDAACTECQRAVRQHLVRRC